MQAAAVDEKVPVLVPPQLSQLTLSLLQIIGEHRLTILSIHSFFWKEGIRPFEEWMTFIAQPFVSLQRNCWIHFNFTYLEHEIV